MKVLLFGFLLAFLFGSIGTSCLLGIGTVARLSVSDSELLIHRLIEPFACGSAFRATASNRRLLFPLSVHPTGLQESHCETR